MVYAEAWFSCDEKTKEAGLAVYGMIGGTDDVHLLFDLLGGRPSAIGCARITRPRFARYF